MRLINKKYLIFLTSILLVITSVLVIKQTKPVELDEVKIIESSNNNSFAMYRETNNGYEEYNDSKFPEGYVLNINESKCLDNKGNEQKGILSYENGLVTVTSGNTSYCYLYFDESLGLEIKNINPNKLSTDVKGDMYRFQGNQTDDVQNYICFGTNDNCGTNEEDISKYMYRIIGIEAKTGRVKVIKKEALSQTYQWNDNIFSDIKLPDSVFFKAINGNDFLDNSEYVPMDWKDKISDNNWLYGDMLDNENGSVQISQGLYEIESGQKATNWYLWSTQEEGGIPFDIKWEGNPAYQQGTTLYYKEVSDKWTDTIKSKVSVMNLSDYSYALDDEAKCNYYYEEKEYSKCRLGWMHLSQNDTDAISPNEWTMSRYGWNINNGAYGSARVSDMGCTDQWTILFDFYSVRPVFYIDASQTLKDGTGKIDDPFIIN